MATVFKPLLPNDIKSTRTLLHEAIPITGTIISGTYGTFPNGLNIKNYAHGMFQSVYDYPFLSSSANHIFDLTVGISNQSALSASTTVQRAKKINMYTQMAAVLMGYDANGDVIQFDRDGDLSVASSTDKINDAIFINFARLLQKDEIKKGSFQMRLGGDTAFGDAMRSILTFTDTGAQNEYKVNAAAGEYAILTCSAGGALSSSGADDTNGHSKAGLIFYQAGIVVLTSSVLQGLPSGSLGVNAILTDTGVTSISGALTGTAISGCCDAFRHRIQDIQFNNTTELNSTIHFCRINSSDFNYSSNPSYLTQSQLIVKNSMTDAPVSYITTVGLYGTDNELLAVAKLSEPLKKDPTNEMIIRVRLDY
jgi:hypothetical protein